MAVDLVRVIGVIAIVAGHTWDQMHFAQNGLYTWHVPVFFFITGYLWKDNRTTGTEIRRRARTLLVPYLAWLIIVSVIWFTFRALRGEPLDTALLQHLPLGGNAISRPYSAFWFVTCLFAAAVVMRWLSNISRFLPWYMAAAGLVWCAGDPHAIASIPESFGTALPALAFILAGRQLRKHLHHIKQPALIGLVIGVTAWWLGWSGAVATLNMKSGNLGDPLTSALMAAAISCGLVLIAEGVQAYLPVVAKRAILVLTSCAIPMILTHTLSLAITERLGYPSSKWTFLIAYFAPLALALIIRATPAKRVLL